MTCPVRVPVAVGVKTTLTVQLAHSGNQQAINYRPALPLVHAARILAHENANWHLENTNRNLSADFLEVIYSPGGHSTDERRPLRHDGREYGLVVSGTLTANVGFESYELGPRDSIAFDSSTPHEYLNKTGDVVRAIWVVVHSEPGRAEAEGPAHPLAEDASNKGRDECADVDSHVEDREAGVAPRSALGIEITDDRRDIRLEESGAQDDENQADVERGLREDDRESDRQMSQRDQHSPVPDRASQSEPPVGNPAAGERGEIHAGGVNADDR